VVILVWMPHQEGAVKMWVQARSRTNTFSTIAGRSSKNSSPSSEFA